jgi:hypothetical protein
MIPSMCWFCGSPQTVLTAGGRLEANLLHDGLIALARRSPASSFVESITMAILQDSHRWAADEIAQAFGAHVRAQPDSQTVRQRVSTPAAHE